VNRKYNTNLAASTIRRNVQNGQVGMLPKRAGPMGLISNEVFHALCGAYRTFIPLVQTEGLKERSRKQLQPLVNAIINKKEREDTRRNENFLKGDGRLLGMWITNKHRSKAKQKYHLPKP
jgi:hypothetical protein